MSGTRAPFVSLAALTAASLAPALGQTASPFDATKRDLRSLPAAEKNALSNDKSAIDKSALPTLTLTPAPAPARAAGNDAKTDAEIARSTNWLLDGVAKLETDADAARLKREKDLERLARSEREDVGNNSAARSPHNASLAASASASVADAKAANPLGSFLTQWLSPRDAALLGHSDLGQPNQLSREQRLDDELRNSRPFSPVGAYQPHPDLAPGTDALQAGQTRNPYLQPDEPRMAADPFRSFLADRPGTPAAESRSGALAPISANGSSAAGQSAFQISPASVPEAQAAPASSPTTRVVDDRKYFPQLRRF
jgi:hypothetical protein